MIIYNPAEHDALIAAWAQAKAALDIAKREEATARKALADAMFFEPQEGTNRVELRDGYALKLQHKLTYSLDKDFMKCKSVHETIRKYEVFGYELADRLIKFSAALSVAEYKKLSAENKNQAFAKQEIDKILTIKEAAPVLELEEPKKKA